MGASPTVCFLYGTKAGHLLLKLVLHTRADRAAVWFLRSRLSRPLVGWYARRHRIPLTPAERARFLTFRDFFARNKCPEIDSVPGHLISPCDGWLSAYPIRADSSFHIKGFSYKLEDLLEDGALGSRYQGGDCLIFRLEASDFHHYCYIDDGCQGENHYIPGALHSVQPPACAAFPVYTLNRRMWTLLHTSHFGPVVQTEVGALVVGGIVPQRSGGPFLKGMEMGRFELAGSTIVLLFERGRMRLLPHIARHLSQGGELRVEQGMWIGLGGGCHD